MRACLAVLTALMLASCGGHDPAPSPTQPKPTTTRETTPPEPEPELQRASCPTTVPACVEASGRIAYVERVDPDGDGDAHFVLLDAAGLTAPGITVVDVRRDLRPRPLPGPGGQLSAAGPLRRGSYDQLQIEAVAVGVAR